jgi:hypothetical protein
MLFHSTLTGVTYSVSPTGAVRVPAPVRTFANRNSFHAKMKAKSPVATIPGSVSGTAIAHETTPSFSRNSGVAIRMNSGCQHYF